MITRLKALDLLHTHMQNKNLRRHCYAVEAVMKALCNYFCEGNKLNNEEKKGNACTKLCEVWGIVGLLHDGDYEEVKKDPSQHTLLMHKWLTDAGENDARILEAILSHNFAHTGNNAPKNNLEWSLFCCDELTGLIVAVALVRPDKKLETVTVESVMKKWNLKQFAAGAKREQIAECEEKLGIKLADFIGIALKAMQNRSAELGL